MKNTKKKLFKFILLLLVLVWLSSFFSPELAIRRYVFFHFQPINSFTVHIENKDFTDSKYGHLFEVRGYWDPITKDEIGVFYLKRYGIFWVVSSVGTGP